MLCCHRQPNPFPWVHPVGPDRNKLLPALATNLHIRQVCFTRRPLQAHQKKHRNGVFFYLKGFKAFYALLPSATEPLSLGSSCRTKPQRSFVCSNYLSFKKSQLLSLEVDQIILTVVKFLKKLYLFHICVRNCCIPTTNYFAFMFVYSCVG